MESTKQVCEDEGRMAVVAGFKSKREVIEKLIRANERLKFISEIEAKAKQVEGLKRKIEVLTGQEKI